MQPPVVEPVLEPARTPSRGGLVFRVRSLWSFLPADVAIQVAPRPQIARIPGAPPGLLGLALTEGVILPVIELGGEPGPMIVCVHRGEQLGLVGVVDVESGMFPAGEGAGVLFRGELVRTLDLEEIYARVHVVRWGAGWG